LGLYGMIGIVQSSELGSGHADAESRWVARRADPRVLILAAAALMLINMPLAWYGKPWFGSGGPPDYFWSSSGVVLILWRFWRHGRLAWACLTISTAVALVQYGLSVADRYRHGWMVDPDHRRSRHPGAGYLDQPAHPPLGR
jgi:hypothetical protein